MSLSYRSYADMSRVISENVAQLPTVDYVVGIPKSGIVPATMIATMKNVTFLDLDSFLFVHSRRKGRRRHADGAGDIPRVLIVDDSVNTGAEFRRVKSKLAALETEVEAHFCAVFGLPDKIRNAPRHIVLSRVAQPRIFQWNYRNHIVAESACFDMDGVLCVDPTDAQNDDGPKYVDFLLNAEPLFIPQKEISAIVTSRLEKYRPETEAWLAANGVSYRELIMLDLPSAEERRRLRAHAPFKAEVYGASDAILFVESNHRQARDIAELTDKPVIETATDTFFYGRADAKNVATDAAGSAILANENHIMRSALQQAASLLHENGFEPPKWVDSFMPTKPGKTPVNTPFRAARAVAAVSAKRVDHLERAPVTADSTTRRIAMIGTSFDIRRGAGAAASSARLRDELKRRGHTVRTFSTDDYPAVGTETSDQPVKGVHLPTWVTLGSTSISERVAEDIDRFKPDCIMLGAIDRSVLSMPDLLDLKYPIVWIARDNWLHTGGCLFKLDDARISELPNLPKSYAAALTCTGYKSGCEACPSVVDKREAAKVSAAYMLKQIVLRRRPDIVFCGISPWMSEMLRQAPLTQNHVIKTAYNPIPRPPAPSRMTCRQELGVSEDQKVILLAVHKAENKRKGFSLAAEALAKLALHCDNPEDIAVAVLGAVDAGALGHLNLPFKVIPVGFLSDEEQKSRLFKAADVCLVPSLQESLSVIASDSLRNGTPVVCFRTSGLADFVHHKANGYTALAFDTDDMAAGLYWTLFEADPAATRSAAQSIAETLFAPENALPVYEAAVEEAIAQFDQTSGDESDSAEISLLLKALGRDSRHRHVVRRHLEKELRKARAG